VRRWPADVPDTSNTPDSRRRLISGLALAPAGANVIMQLSRLPIGRAVAESKVHSGSLRHHPLKRTRTTLAFIMVALFGTDYERAVMRREINAQHRFVRSDHESAVAYDALDPELQLWSLRACSGGVVDTVTLLYGPVNDEGFTTLLKRSAPFATTLQVSESRWPTDRESFEAYWTGALDDVHMDDVTRAYCKVSLRWTSCRSARATPGTESPIPHRRFSPGALSRGARSGLDLEESATLCSNHFSCGRGQPPPTEGDREFPWNIIEYDTHDGSLGDGPSSDRTLESFVARPIGSDRRRHGRIPKGVAFEKHER